MKRNAKVVAICIAAIMVLVLMCGVLVACNKDKNGANGSIAQLISLDELEHMVGFVATEGAKDGQNASITCVASDMAQMDDYDAKFGKHAMYVNAYLDKTGEEDSKGGTMYVLEGESQAKAYYDKMNEEEKAYAKLDGKYIFIEKEEGYFKNTILKGTLPSTFSKTRMDFIKECAKQGEISCYLSVDIATNYKYDAQSDAETYDEMECELGFDGTNCEYSYSYSKIPQGQNITEEQKASMLENCTSDSYIDTTKEAGYVFMKLVQKPGLVFDDTTVYVGEDTFEGLEVEDYYYDKNSSKNLVVPATSGTKNVISAGITYSNLVTIELSEGILEMRRFSYNDELTTISLPKSLKKFSSYCPFEDCPKLTTIKYAGTQAEWEALLEANGVNVNEDWCTYETWDSATQSSVTKNITFSVQCSDHTITYPTAA